MKYKPWQKLSLNLCSNNEKMLGEKHKEMDDVFKMSFVKKENNLPKTLHQNIAYYTHD